MAYQVKTFVWTKLIYRWKTPQNNIWWIYKKNIKFDVLY